MNLFRNFKPYQEKWQRYWQSTLYFLSVLHERFVTDGCMYRAAGLTFTSLLSLVPLMTVGFAVLSGFPRFRELGAQVQNFIFTHFVATSGQIIQSYLQYFVGQTANLSAFGFLFLIITAVLMMYNMEQAFNVIWRVKERRKGISAVLLYWAVLTLSPLLLGLSILLSTYVTSYLSFLTALTALGLGSLFPFLFSAVTFAIFYIAIPNCRVPIRYGLIGAIVAALLFEIAKISFAYYIRLFPTYTLLYGTLATIPIFLIWLYTCWVIILFGAILSNVLSFGYFHRSPIKVDAFTHIYHWLGYFWIAFQEGKSLTLQDLIAMDPYDYKVKPEYQLDLLLAAKLIQRTYSDRYILRKDLSRFTLNELLEAMPWGLPKINELKRWPGRWETGLLKIIEEMEPKIQADLDVPLSQLYSDRSVR